jgi:salicylate hydroxylase
MGLQPENTIRFTGRVHMSGYTKPLSHLSTTDLGIGHWMLYNDCILTTWPCKENRQWFIGVKAAPPDEKSPDRSVWKGATSDTVNAVYGSRFHPFGEDGTVEASMYAIPAPAIAGNSRDDKLSIIPNASSLATSSRKPTSRTWFGAEWRSWVMVYRT